jgi:signal recognition particle receptor subunit beta
VDSKRSVEPQPARRRPPTPVKIVIAGGFGVGKTTAVGSISESPPLRTEASITSVSAEIDRTGHVPSKVTTTVALDFGSITIDDEVKLYLFGTPGQDRFGFMWHDLVHGALGALVIVDTRRLDDCYPAVDYFEKAGVPFVVAVNTFDGMLAHELDDVRWALAMQDHVPLITFDARARLSVRDALLVVLRTSFQRATTAPTPVS